MSVSTTGKIAGYRIDTINGNANAITWHDSNNSPTDLLIANYSKSISFSISSDSSTIVGGVIDFNNKQYACIWKNDNLINLNLSENSIASTCNSDGSIIYGTNDAGTTIYKWAKDTDYNRTTIFNSANTVIPIGIVDNTLCVFKFDNNGNNYGYLNLDLPNEIIYITPKTENIVNTFYGINTGNSFYGLQIKDNLITLLKVQGDNITQIPNPSYMTELYPNYILTVGGFFR